MDVVEIDEAIIRVAKDQFGFKTSDSSRVFHKDGIEFVENYGQPWKKLFHFNMFAHKWQLVLSFFSTWRR